MAIAIKICGLNSPETMDAALDAGADMVGLVIFPPSPRHVDMTVARQLADQARGRCQIVALTVDASDQLLDEINTAINPDMIQLHGSEAPQRVAQMRRAAGRPVIKALGIASARDLDQMDAYREAADIMLLDAKPPKQADRPGGHGKPFDWSILQALDPSAAFMLSGGLTVDNITNAVRMIQPPAIDVSSGVERSAGIKDNGLIRDFIARARAAAAGAD